MYLIIHPTLFVEAYGKQVYYIPNSRLYVFYLLTALSNQHASVSELSQFVFYNKKTEDLDTSQ